MDRRKAIVGVSSVLLAATQASKALSAFGSGQLSRGQDLPKHLLSTSLFGHTAIEEILPIARELGMTALDVWPKVHGSQREQLSEMGEERFSELLTSHGCKLDCLTQYPLGPFGLGLEMRLAKRFGCGTIVTGSGGPKGLKGDELKRAVKDFAERMKPHLELAQECGVTIAIENHASSLLDSPESIRWLFEMRASDRLGIAFAPYHLPQDESLLQQLIRDVLPSIQVFYAWQHGKGCMQAQEKQDERLQLPGRGSLDFGPLFSELRKGRYSRWVEVFMHPFPRGIPIAEDLASVSELLRECKSYVDRVWHTAGV